MLKDIETKEELTFLMEHFYAQAFHDEVIGKYFTDVHQLNLETHIPRFVAFWETSVLEQGGYKGNMMEAHLPLHEKAPFEAAHFERWLTLFRNTVDAHFAGTNAEKMKQRAWQMAVALQVKTCGYP